MPLLQKGRWGLSIALALVVSPALHGGPITVIPAVSANGSLFHYDFSISNSSGSDLAVLDITVTPGAANITHLTTPVGFKDAYDPILGLVSFLEDTATFGSSPISGFAFDSPLGSGPTTFTATLVDSNFAVSTMTGSTSGPVVPEPGYLPVLALGAAVLFYARRRGPHICSSSY